MITGPICHLCHLMLIFSFLPSVEQIISQMPSSDRVNRFNQRISCYTLDRTCKRNWLQLFVYFFNASMPNSFISYNRLAQRKLSYLNYIVSVTKSLCSDSKQINLGRSPSEKKSRLASPQFILHIDNEIHVSVKRTFRYAYCSTKEGQIRSNIDCFTCQVVFGSNDEKNRLFDHCKLLFNYSEWDKIY